MTDINSLCLADSHVMLSLAHSPAKAWRFTLFRNVFARRSPMVREEPHCCSPAPPLQDKSDCLEVLYENWRSVPPLRFVRS